MSVKKNRYESNEIITTVDKNNEGVNYVENQDAIASAYGATMVITGLVAQEQTVPDMTIKLTKGVAEDNTVENILISEEFPAITISPADVSQDRRDVIEMRRLIVDITPESRNFKDPNTLAISSAIIETEQKYVTEIKVLTGSPGGVAVGVESNWIKIAEILVPASSSSVVNTNIFNVDAEAVGLENTDWTNDITSIFRNGSISDIKSNIDEIWKTGVPEWKEFRKYNAFTSYVQDQGMVWQSRIGSNLDNQPSINQDKWYPISAPNIEEALEDGDIYTPVFKNAQLIGDTNVGDADITVGDPKFLGQELIFSNNGTGFATYTHPDFSYGVIVDSDHNPKVVSVSDGSGGLKWDVGSQVSADYVGSAADRVVMCSNRGMNQYYSGTVAITNNEGTGWYGGNVTITHDVEFLEIPTAHPDSNVDGTGGYTRPSFFINQQFGYWSTTQSRYKGFNESSAESRIYTIKIEGEYA